MKQMYVNHKKEEAFENALYEAGIDFKLDPQADNQSSSTYIILEDTKIGEAKKILTGLA